MLRCNSISSSNSKSSAIITELSVEEYNKVQKIRKLQKSGVPEEAVKARCKYEKIEYRWLQQEVVIKQQQPNPVSNSLTKTEEELFLLNNEGNVDFHYVKAPLTALVKIFVATVQRRGELDIKTGTGTYISVPLQDLCNALGCFRAVQYDRDLFLSTFKQDDTITPNEDTIRCKRRRFQQHLVSLGMRTIQPNDINKNIIPGLDGLIYFLDSITKINSTENSTTASSGITANNHMFTFNDLGNMFSPGIKCIARNAVTTGVDCLVQVIWSRYEHGKTLGGIVKRFVVSFQVVCAVQNHFGIAEFTEHMLEFEHYKNIDSLPFTPLNVLSEADKVLSQAYTRGELYQNICIGSHFMGYRKGTFYPKGIKASTNSAAASKIDGRVMVDIMGSYEVGHSVSTGYDGIILAMQEKSKEFMVYLRQQRKSRSSSIDLATNKSSSISEDGPLLMKSIPEHLIELTWPSVTGFSFTSKAWGDILVDGLFQIEFAEASFDQLVLPPSQKRMIKALVRHSSDSFHDIISGKGEGSVFLLYGPPGVGKTLTAEAISEMLHRPLYSVSLGQLGITPSELETKLGEILELCSKWDALILLDEADIFLEKRTKGGSLERNAMVSVMLRLVEYFKGVLFLTSNRVDSLDPAFKTRITLALRYEALDEQARSRVWRNLLVASGQGELLQSGTIRAEELASRVLNGREIKNSIRLALALAAEDGTSLTQETLLETVELVCDFNEKLNSAEAY